MKRVSRFGWVTVLLGWITGTPVLCAQAAPVRIVLVSDDAELRRAARTALSAVSTLIVVDDLARASGEEIDPAWLWARGRAERASWLFWLRRESGKGELRAYDVQNRRVLGTRRVDAVPLDAVTAAALVLSIKTMAQELARSAERQVRPREPVTPAAVAPTVVAPPAVAAGEQPLSAAELPVEAAAERPLSAAAAAVKQGQRIATTARLSEAESAAGEQPLSAASSTEDPEAEGAAREAVDALRSEAGASAPAATPTALQATPSSAAVRVDAPTPAEPNVLPDGIADSSIDIRLSALAARIEQHAQLRLGLGATWWPRHGPLGVELHADAGTFVAIDAARAWEGALAASALLRMPTQRWRFVLGVGPRVHVLRRWGALAGVGFDTLRAMPGVGALLRLDFVITPTFQVGLWGYAGYLLAAQRYFVDGDRVYDSDRWRIGGGPALAWLLP
jgi:hypothetical protein